MTCGYCTAAGRPCACQRPPAPRLVPQLCRDGFHLMVASSDRCTGCGERQR